MSTDDREPDNPADIAAAIEQWVVDEQIVVRNPRECLDACAQWIAVRLARQVAAIRALKEFWDEGMAVYDDRYPAPSACASVPWGDINRLGELIGALGVTPTEPDGEK